MSAMFIRTSHSIRVSLRSRGSDVDVNVCSRAVISTAGDTATPPAANRTCPMDETLKKFPYVSYKVFRGVVFSWENRFFTFDVK